MIRYEKLVICLFLFLFGLLSVVNQDTKNVVPQMSLKQYVKTFSKMVDPTQITCLAKNIFYEAGGESIIGQAAVARVVLNRVGYGFAKTPCGVIYQTTLIEHLDEAGELITKKVCQFSWVCEEKEEPTNNPRYRQAQEIAKLVLVYNAYSDVIPKSTLYFHNSTVNPNWQLQKVAIIGNHTFYSKNKK